MHDTGRICFRQIVARGRGPAVPEEAGDLLNRDTSVEEQRDEAVPQLASASTPPESARPPRPLFGMSAGGPSRPGGTGLGRALNTGS